MKKLFIATSILLSVSAFADCDSQANLTLESVKAARSGVEMQVLTAQYAGDSLDQKIHRNTVIVAYKKAESGKLAELISENTRLQCMIDVAK